MATTTKTGNDNNEDRGKDDEVVVVVDDDDRITVHNSPTSLSQNPLPTTATTTQVPSVPSSSVPSTSSSSSLFLSAAEREIRRRKERSLLRLLTRPDVLPSFLAAIQPPTTRTINTTTTTTSSLSIGKSQSKQSQQPLQGMGESKSCEENNNNNNNNPKKRQHCDVEDKIQVYPYVVIDVDVYLGFKKRKLKEEPPKQSQPAQPVFPPSSATTIAATAPEIVSSSSLSVTIPSTEPRLLPLQWTTTTSSSSSATTATAVVRLDTGENGGQRFLPILSSGTATTSTSTRTVVPPSSFTPSSPTLSSSSTRTNQTTTSAVITTNTTTAPVTNTAIANTSMMTPADEGFYEGTRIMALEEDERYLGDVHQAIRRHLEYFSATREDVTQCSQAGRRTKAMIGQVGIRCIHCAKHIMEEQRQRRQQQEQRHRLDNTNNNYTSIEKVHWPPGALSYPLKLEGLYTTVSQKPQLHFESCPYLPPNSRLAQMLQEARANQQQEQSQHQLQQHHDDPQSATTGNDIPSSSGGSSTAGVGLPLPPLTGIGKRKRMVQGVSGLMYYVISCQRIGIEEIPGGKGLRFTRDLKLEPLEFEPVRTRLEEERPDLVPRQYQKPKPTLLSSSLLYGPTTTATTTSSSHPVPQAKVPRLTGTNDDASSNAIINGSTTVTMSISSPTTTGSSEFSSEVQSILQRALEEAGHPEEHPLIRREDKHYLTDYMFLAISQMALCWASPQDFIARGKKTKLMRLGFAGFCCRHCRHQTNATYSCRSYSSAPDNLASAISNSFVLHLQKCPYTPREIQSALSTCKRIHSRQMSQLPYGSQRKIFFELWNRLRAADRPSPPTTTTSSSVASPKSDNVNNRHEDEDDDDDNDDDDGDGGIEEDESTTTTTEEAGGLTRHQKKRRRSDDEEDWNPSNDGGPFEEHEDDEDDVDHGGRKSKPLTPPVPWVPPTTITMDRPNSRALDFPVCSDPEVKAVLQEASEIWDLARNDDLILPEDRYLVSDYVFLTMRQLKVAMPRPTDFTGNRRSNVLQRMPGLCCIHCAEDPTLTTPSGRSFPSAPDNMASALNSSFYNHMQYCPRLDPKIKRTLVQLRKIHSQQCSSMTFGSQRRFFNKVYGKLKAIPVTNHDDNPWTPVAASASTSTSNGPLRPTDIFLEHDFVECGTLEIPFWQCLKCRMVPFEFRAVGGVHYVKPIPPHLKHHRSICKEDGIHLGWTTIAIKKMCTKYECDHIVDAIKPLIELVVGHDPDLTSLFLGCVSSSARRPDGTKTTLEEKPKNTRGWWRRLPTSVDSVQLQSLFKSRTAPLLGLSSSDSLSDHPIILRVLEIISPCL